MRRPGRCLLLPLALLLLGGCVDPTLQTRYIPRHSELTWDKEYKQLPWRPPHLEERHLRRRGRPAKPYFPPETNFDVGEPVTDYRYAGDRKEGDSGRAGLRDGAETTVGE